MPDDVKIQVSTPGARRAEQDLKRVAQGERQVGRHGKEAGEKLGEAGREGQKSFRGLRSVLGGVKSILGAAGIAVGLTGVISLMKRVYEYAEKIAAAEWDIVNALRARHTAAGGLLGEQLAREVRDVTGWSLKDVRRRAIEGARRYDVTPGDVMGAVKPIWSRMPEAQREAALAEALTLASAGGMPGQAAGAVPALLYEQFGARDPAQRQKMMAMVRAVAQSSAYTTGQFANILSRVAPSLSDAGLGLAEQLAYVSAMSQFAPTEPSRTGTALEQLSTLTLRKTPFMEQLLRRAGRQPTSRNMQDIMDALGVYLAGGGDLQALQEETQIPLEVLRQIQRAQKGAFGAKYAAALTAAGGAEWKTITGEVRGALKEPGAQARRAALGTEMEKTRFAPPGTYAEATEIFERFTGELAIREGYREAVVKYRRDYAGRLTPDEATYLYELDSLYEDYVRPALLAVKGGPDWEGEVDWKAGGYVHQLDILKKDAHTWHWPLSDQRYWVLKYGEKLMEAVEFLRQVELGGGFTDSRVGRSEQQYSTAAQRQAARPTGDAGTVWPAPAAGPSPMPAGTRTLTASGAGRGAATTYVGGTHFHGTFTDPAGRPRLPANAP